MEGRQYESVTSKTGNLGRRSSCETLASTLTGNGRLARRRAIHVSPALAPRGVFASPRPLGRRRPLNERPRALDFRCLSYTMLLRNIKEPLSKTAADPQADGSG